MNITNKEEVLVTPKQRGRPPKVIEPVRLNSFMAALASSEASGRSISYLEKVSGLNRREAAAVIRGLTKAGKIKQLGKKKGTTYVLA